MAEPISITLPVEQWNVIAAGLAELPFKVATPLLHEIQRQVTAATAQGASDGVSDRH